MQWRLPLAKPRSGRWAASRGDQFRCLSSISGEECAAELLPWSKSLVTRARTHLQPRELAGSDEVRLLRRDATTLQGLCERVVAAYLEERRLRRKAEDIAAQNRLTRLDRDVHEGVLYSDYASFLASWDDERAEQRRGAPRG